MSCLTRQQAAGRFGVPAALLALPALLLAWSPVASAWAAYDRSRIAAGELWRVVTGHWAHWNLDHLSWDLLAFAILMPLCLRLCARRAWATLAAATLLIPLGVWSAIPGMTEYRGLSGIDSALFMLLATSLLIRSIRERGWGMATIFGAAIVAFTAKIGVELSTGSGVFVESGAFVPVPLAHVIGAACGMLTALWSRPDRSRLDWCRGTSIESRCRIRRGSEDPMA